MRLWSIHPKYLDSKGLLAVWREALLAQKVLSGKTKGYRNHPQLNRFKKAYSPLVAIRVYLLGVYNQARMRGYAFDKGKINLARGRFIKKITVSRAQVAFELQHLLLKLKSRDINRYKSLLKLKRVCVHPIFRIRPGKLEDWEKILIDRRN